MMKPSNAHNNRQWHNWLIYVINDKCLEKYSKYLKGHLVDLGCGEAPYKKYFSQFIDKYTGVDWSNTFHNSAADIVSDLNVQIKIDDEVADSIISISVMEHLFEPQIFLNEAYRVLKRDGYMVLQVPWQWRVHESPHDYFRYTPYALKYMFAKAGFEDIEIESQGGFFTTVLIKANYFLRRFVKGPKIIRRIITVLLIPLWTIFQFLAPILDRLDRHPTLEASGYFVLAKKK
jgi:SAM-dependent methyltransferase